MNNRTESPRRLLSSSPLRSALLSERAILLLGVAGAVLLAVPIARAQGTNIGTIASGQMIHVLQPGAPTGDEGRASPGPTQSDGTQQAPGGASAGLVIIPAFDVSITGDPNAVAIENAINTAIDNITSQFSDPITVHITFQTMTSGLGQSSSYYSNVSVQLVPRRAERGCQDERRRQRRGSTPICLHEPGQRRVDYQRQDGELEGSGDQREPTCRTTRRVHPFEYNNHDPGKSGQHRHL